MLNCTGQFIHLQYITMLYIFNSLPINYFLMYNFQVYESRLHLNSHIYECTIIDKGKWWLVFTHISQTLTSSIYVYDQLHRKKQSINCPFKVNLMLLNFQWPSIIMFSCTNARVCFFQNSETNCTWQFKMTLTLTFNIWFFFSLDQAQSPLFTVLKLPVQ